MDHILNKGSPNREFFFTVKIVTSRSKNTEDLVLQINQKELCIQTPYKVRNTSKFTIIYQSSSVKIGTSARAREATCGSKTKWRKK